MLSIILIILCKFSSGSTNKLSSNKGTFISEASVTLKIEANKLLSQLFPMYSMSKNPLSIRKTPLLSKLVLLVFTV